VEFSAPRSIDRGFAGASLQNVHRGSQGPNLRSLGCRCLTASEYAAARESGLLLLIEATLSVERALDARLVDHEISFDQFRVLSTLLDAGGREMTQVEVAQAIHFRPSSLAELVKRLEGQGALARRTDPMDRRAKLLSLTRPGRDLAHASGKTVRDTLSEIAALIRDVNQVSLLDAIVRTS
jgi:MarR family transcriptional regulator for hemolysin